MVREWWTARELAELGLPGLPGTKSASIRRAAREGWKCREKIIFGGKAFEYHVSSLPQSAREVLSALAPDGATADFTPPHPNPLPRGEREKRGRTRRSAPTQTGRGSGVGATGRSPLHGREGHGGGGQARGVAPTEAGAALGARPAREAPASRAAGLAGFEGLPEARKREALAKLELLEACQEFIDRAGIKNRRRGAEQFCVLCKLGQIQVSGEAAKAARRGGERSLSWASLERWRRAYAEKGLRGLVNGYHSPSRSTVPEDVQAFIAGLITQFPHIKPKRILEAVEARFWERADRPSEAAIRRWVQRFRAENEGLLLYLADPEAWKSKRQWALGDASENATALNQVWEMDSTKTDVMLLDGRHTIIGNIDVWSRRLRMLVAPTSKGAHVAALIRRCLLDWGVPETIKTDNGQDYVSRYLTAVIDNLGIEQVLCPPFTPEAKPHIERAFRTFAHGFEELLPGYIGHSVAERKAIEGRKSFADRIMKRGGEPIAVSMTAAEMQEFCDRWTAAIYDQNRHEGLGMSPAAKAREWTGRVRRVEDERALDMLLMTPADGEWRTVHKKGVKVEGAWFISADLPEPRSRVRVLLDPTDYGAVYVYGADGSFAGRAVNPERTGIDRQEVATRAKEAQKAALRAGVKRLKKVAKEAGAAAIHEEILAHREARVTASAAAHRSESYTTQALEEARRAAALRDGDAPWPEEDEEMRAARARIEAEMAAEAESRAAGRRRKVEPISTPQRDYARWVELDGRHRQGLALSEKEARFYKSFAGTPDWLAMRKMEEDFGAFYLER